MESPIQTIHVITIEVGHGEQNNMEETNTVTNTINNSKPTEDWLPITESRNGNTFTSVLHLVSSGIGFQAVLLPVAFASLGWTWGVIVLTLIYSWQLYTAWLLVHLHEAVPGTRYSRYLQLAMVSFGPKLGKLLALFPVMYLSGGTCVMLIITGGGTMETIFKMLCSGEPICDARTPTGAEWFLVFTCIAIVLAQRPNLNSVAGYSLLGAVTAITYCTLLWVLPVFKDRPSGVSYDKLEVENSDIRRFSSIFNAIGIVALAFRGHNLVLEIQGTLPSSPKSPSKKLMWRGVIISYALIPMCLFPLAIAGFWSYGNKIPSNQGMLTALTQFHGENTSKAIKGLIHLLLVTNCLSSFQIYAMPVFDNLELRYITVKNERCPWWVRVGFRIFFGGITFFISVAFPFMPSLAPVIGGIALPLSLVYPCFMWILIKKPRASSTMWCFNLVLGFLGVLLSVGLVVAAMWNLSNRGLNANVFHPQ